MIRDDKSKRLLRTRLRSMALQLDDEGRALLTEAAEALERHLLSGIKDRIYKPEDFGIDSAPSHEQAKLPCGRQPDESCPEVCCLETPSNEQQKTYEKFGTLLPLGERPKETDAEINAALPSLQHDRRPSTRLRPRGLSSDEVLREMLR